MREREYDAVPTTVAHIYDHTARGVVEVQDPKDPVIMVRWGISDKLTPAIRDEVCSVDLPKRSVRRRKDRDEDENED